MSDRVTNISEFAQETIGKRNIDIVAIDDSDVYDDNNDDDNVASTKSHEIKEKMHVDKNPFEDILNYLVPSDKIIITHSDPNVLCDFDENTLNLPSYKKSCTDDDYSDKESDKSIDNPKLNDTNEINPYNSQLKNETKDDNQDLLLWCGDSSEVNDDSTGNNGIISSSIDGMEIFSIMPTSEEHDNLSNTVLQNDASDASEFIHSQEVENLVHNMDINKQAINDVDPLPHVVACDEDLAYYDSEIEEKDEVSFDM